MMVMPDRDRSVTVAISVGIGSLVRSHMDMGRMLILVRLGQRDSGPIGGVPHRMLRLRQPMQVHGRQEGDAQTDAEVAKQVRQRRAPTARVAFSSTGGNPDSSRVPPKVSTAPGADSGDPPGIRLRRSLPSSRPTGGGAC